MRVNRRDGAAASLLAELLEALPGALVTAMGPEARLAPLPASVELHGQRVFVRPAGLDLIVPDDVVLIIDAWRRAQQEPIVTVEVHLVAEPDRLATVHFVDARSDHGVHVLVLDVDDPDLILATVDALDAQRRGVGHVVRDELAVFLEVDDGACAVLGWTRAELLGRRTIDFVHPDDVDRAVTSWMAMRAGTDGGRGQIRFRRPDGRYVWLEVTHDERQGERPDGGLVSELVDITDQMADLQALHERERHLHHLADALPVGICHVRGDRHVAYTNAPLEALLGPVQSVEDLIQSVATMDRPIVELAIERALDGEPGALEVGLVHGCGNQRCDLTFRTMSNEQGGTDGVIVCAADVTERSRLRSELEHRATHDALTGCLNRAAIVAALERVLREGRPAVVAFIDVDAFKAVNDELGHAAGDELLRVAAERLREVTRTEDRLGRIGGDEFVVVCPQGRGANDGHELAERLHAAVCRDVTFAGHLIPLRASIGVAVSQPGEMDSEALLSRADAAMYDMKRGVRR